MSEQVSYIWFTAVTKKNKMKKGGKNGVYNKLIVASAYIAQLKK